MPRYFFHIEDGQTFTDFQGTELADLVAAKREAVRFAGALLVERPDEFWGSGEWTVRVTDAQNLTLFSLWFLATESPAIRTDLGTDALPATVSR